MKKIKLDDYKEYRVYYHLFDSYIKTNNIKKQALFDVENISFSSYVRCKDKETKTTKAIYLKLCQAFEILPLSLKKNRIIEERLNDIYLNVYYKAGDNYEDELLWLDSLINEKYTLFPLLHLFKLFILVNITPPKKLKENYFGLYQEIVKYEDFYFNEFYEIYLLVDLIFSNNVKYSRNIYKNELLYQALATTYYLKEDYNMALAFALQAEANFIKNENFMRIIMTKITIMSCHNACRDYKSAYKEATKLYYSLKAFKQLSNEIQFVYFNYLIACIGLGRYEEALRFLNVKTKYNINDVLAYVIVHSKLNLCINLDLITNKLNGDLDIGVIRRMIDDINSIDIEPIMFINKYRASKLYTDFI